MKTYVVSVVFIRDVPLGLVDIRLAMKMVDARSSEEAEALVVGSYAMKEEYAGFAFKMSTWVELDVEGIAIAEGDHVRSIETVCG